MPFGREVTIDLYGCDSNTFTRIGITAWLEELCRRIGMKREDLHFWDYKGTPKREIPADDLNLVGTSAVQFISTSHITIHTLDLVGEAYINIFSHKEFDPAKAAHFSGSWFKATNLECKIIERGKESKSGINEVIENGRD
jgi:S-adenosylmethionine/arginine decarboxylase-like enzyme